MSSKVLKIPLVTEDSDYYIYQFLVSDTEKAYVCALDVEGWHNNSEKGSIIELEYGLPTRVGACYMAQLKLKGKPSEKRLTVVQILKEGNVTVVRFEEKVLNVNETGTLFIKIEPFTNEEFAVKYFYSKKMWDIVNETSGGGCLCLGGGSVDKARKSSQEKIAKRLKKHFENYQIQEYKESNVAVYDPLKKANKKA